jgi:acyl carrier protein
VEQSDRILGTIKTFLKHQKKEDSVELGTALFADGIGLDSLQTAELSVMLEDELGRDPFSAGQFPQTVGEIVEFYGEKPA